MTKIEFITVNKPDAKKAAELLGPILYNAIIKKRLSERDESSRYKQKEFDQLDSGDSVA